MNEGYVTFGHRLSPTPISEEHEYNNKVIETKTNINTIEAKLVTT